MELLTFIFLIIVSFIIVHFIAKKEQAKKRIEEKERRKIEQESLKRAEIEALEEAEEEYKRKVIEEKDKKQEEQKKLKAKQEAILKQKEVNIEKIRKPKKERINAENEKRKAEQEAILKQKEINIEKIKKQEARLKAEQEETRLKAEKEAKLKAEKEVRKKTDADKEKLKSLLSKKRNKENMIEYNINSIKNYQKYIDESTKKQSKNLTFLIEEYQKYIPQREIIIKRLREEVQEIDNQIKLIQSPINTENETIKEKEEDYIPKVETIEEEAQKEESKQETEKVTEDFIDLDSLDLADGNLDKTEEEKQRAEQDKKIAIIKKAILKEKQKELKTKLLNYAINIYNIRKEKLNELWHKLEYSQKRILHKQEQISNKLKETAREIYYQKFANTTISDPIINKKNRDYLNANPYYIEALNIEEFKIENLIDNNTDLEYFAIPSYNVIYKNETNKNDKKILSTFQKQKNDKIIEEIKKAEQVTRLRAEKEARLKAKQESELLKFTLTKENFDKDVKIIFTDDENIQDEKISNYKEIEDIQRNEAKIEENKEEIAIKEKNNIKNNQKLKTLLYKKKSKENMIEYNTNSIKNYKELINEWKAKNKIKENGELKSLIEEHEKYIYQREIIIKTLSKELKEIENQIEFIQNPIITEYKTIKEIEDTQRNEQKLEETKEKNINYIYPILKPLKEFSNKPIDLYSVQKAKIKAIKRGEKIENISLFDMFGKLQEKVRV